MEENKLIPTSLKVVAWLFILSAIGAVIEFAARTMCGQIHIPLGILGFFIGAGLLKLKRGWRTCALIFIWIGLVGIPVGSLLLLTFAHDPLYYELFGLRIAYIPKIAVAPFIIFGFLIILWEYRVLTRNDIKKLFKIESV